MSLTEIYPYFFYPMDSTRYFEFGFLSEVLKEGGFNSCLDVSSPRLFSLSMLREYPRSRVTFLNPDATDLEMTRRAALSAGFGARCEFLSRPIEQVDADGVSYDLVVCISVLEHIRGDTVAIGKMWDLLSPGGRLLLSVPCAAEGWELFLDRDLYGVGNSGAGDEAYFFEYVYDTAQLEQRIFSVAGRPCRQGIWGEKVPGELWRMCDSKWGNEHYPFWREPAMSGTRFKSFASVEQLPGEGVIAMEFVKK